MDFAFTKDQQLIRRSAKEFLKKECPTEKVRELDQSEQGFSAELWSKMTELGWMGIPFSETYQGSGGDFFDLMIVIEEMGRHVFPGPFFSTMILGVMPLLKAGNEEQKRSFLPGVADGKIILTMALTEPEARYKASAVQTRAKIDNGEYVINGTKLFIPDAHIADYLLCVARTNKNGNPEKGITIFMVDAKSPGLTTSPLKTITREKQFEVIFDNVQVSPENILGQLDNGWKLVEDTLEKAAAARSAEMIGGAQAGMDMALEYAKKRIQFDRPIGSFQAVQHYFADMWMAINGCRHLVYKAGWKIARGEPAGKITAMAKARAGEVYREVSTRAHQILGGIGFTHEHDMHLYYRRAIGCDLSFGSTDYQKEIVAKELGI